MVWELLSVHNPSSFLEVTKTHPLGWGRRQQTANAWAIPGLRAVFVLPVKLRMVLTFF